jgi:hypothetical protein
MLDRGGHTNKDNKFYNIGHWFRLSKRFIFTGMVSTTH